MIARRLLPQSLRITRIRTFPTVRKLTMASDAHPTHVPIRTLLQTYESGKTLPQGLYTSDAVYDFEMTRFWPQSWLFAGYENQIAKSGDYFVYNIGTHSILITRDKTHKVRAFHNICRHRGSRLVLAPSGHSKHFCCKYHAWSYDLEGNLVHASEMQDNCTFNPRRAGLLPVEVAAISGLVFVRIHRPTNPSMETDGTSIDAARRVMEPQLGIHKLTHTKIAHTILYTVKANAKITMENNRECQHCDRGTGHKEYIQANYDTAFIYKDGKRIPDPANSRRAQEATQVIQEQTTLWHSLGLPFECTSDNSFVHGGWFRCTRLPLRRGWVTESLDGKPVCSLLLGGTPPARNLGSLRIHTYPNFWLHCSGDHAVSTRLTPLDKQTTECKVDWLVHADAVENRDYSLERMLPFWQKTSEQDWALCEAHQLGVVSSAYGPSLLSVRKETGLRYYLDWYVERMKKML